ncbi:MAG: phytoene desaturase family protein [Pseudomonadota bacterium]
MTRTDKPFAAAAVHPDRPHAAVIGAGFGGMAAAIRLAARGWRVSLFEKNEQPGGRAAVFQQDGYSFDAGPTIVTAPFMFEELWALCGREMADDVTLKPLDPFYEIRFDDGHVFRASGDPERMRAEVAKLSPGDVDGYERYLEDSGKNYAYGFEKLGFQAFDKLSTMAKALPKLIGLRADRSVYRHAASRIRDPRLRIALSFHPLFIGGNPLRVTSVYSLIAYLERLYGVHFAMGGTTSLVQGLTKLMAIQNVDLRLNAEVEEIRVKDRQVRGLRLASGEQVDADIVVSNGCSAWTYSKMTPQAARKRWTDKRLADSHYSMGLFVWYFGTDRRYDDVAHHSILLGPRYKPLLGDIFDRKKLAEDMSIYLYRPTASDPSLAPPGGDAFYALSPVPHLGAGVDWTAETARYRAKLLARLEETALPGLRDHLVTEKIQTPADFGLRLNSYLGSAFGLEPRLLQSAWFRPHNRSEDVDGLYLVGAGTHPGAGLPGVLTSARILDDLVPHASAVA